MPMLVYAQRKETIQPQNLTITEGFLKDGSVSIRLPVNSDDVQPHFRVIADSGVARHLGGYYTLQYLIATFTLYRIDSDLRWNF